MECTGSSSKKHKVHLTTSGDDFQEVDHFVNADGQHIFCKCWYPSNPPKALLLIVHGYAEHCRRHEKLAQAMADDGFYVFSQDLACHGESEGQRINVSSCNVFVRDLLQQIKEVRGKFPQLPLFVFGHSMGGAITTLLAHQNPELALSGVVLSSALIMKTAEFTNPIKVGVLKILSYIVPNIGVGTLDANKITTDKDQVKEYTDDPLVYHGPVILNMGVQLLYMIEEVERIIPDVSFPFLVLHGADDDVTYPDGSRNIHKTACSKDKSIKIFDGCLHELVHEAGQVPDTFVNDVKAWINERV